MPNPTSQRIQFIPCPEEDGHPSDADQGLRNYAAALNLMEPNWAVRSLDPSADNGHLHSLALMKMGAMSGTTFGVVTSTTPHRVAHEIDPTSGGWSSNPSTPNTGIIYGVQTSSGDQFLAIRYQ